METKDGREAEPSTMETKDGREAEPSAAAEVPFQATSVMHLDLRLEFSDEESAPEADMAAQSNEPGPDTLSIEDFSLATHESPQPDTPSPTKKTRKDEPSRDRQLRFSIPRGCTALERIQVKLAAQRHLRAERMRGQAFRGQAKLS